MTTRLWDPKSHEYVNFPEYGNSRHSTTVLHDRSEYVRVSSSKGTRGRETTRTRIQPLCDTYIVRCGDRRVFGVVYVTHVTVGKADLSRYNTST